MPLYEYQCRECGLRFERIEKASALRNGICPDCGEVAHRLIGAPALQFKGSGWYINDYGKSNGASLRATSEHCETATSATEPKADPKPKSETERKTDTKVA